MFRQWLRCVRRARWGATLLFVAALCLSGTSAADAPQAPGGPKAPDRKWLPELAGADSPGFTGYPGRLGWQADHPESYPASFLVVGTRPVGDRPRDGVTVRGEKRLDGDWVVADDSGAIWVTGLPAPEVGKPVVLSGRFTREGGKLALKGIRFVVAGRREGTTVAHPGDFVYYPLGGTKETTCPVEIAGDAAEVAFTDQRDTLVVRAVKPGSAKIEMFLVGGFDDQPTLGKEYLLTVEVAPVPVQPAPAR